MDLVLITDNNYILPTYVTIFSFIQNYEGDEMANVHICGVDLSDPSAHFFDDLNGRCKIIVHNISMELFDEKLKNIKQHTHVTTTALIKFELANILDDLSKVLYIDGDIIVKKDLAELYKNSLDGYLVAAVHDFWKTIDGKNKTGKIDVTEFYFNSGVMLINLDAFRKEGIPDKLWAEKIKQCQTKTELMDQNVLNTVCNGRVLRLPVIYNFNVAFSDYSNIDLINDVYGTRFSNATNLLENSAILHYVGKHDKPWKYGNAKCRDIWLEYFNKTKLDGCLIGNEVFEKNTRYYWKRAKKLIKQHGLFGAIKYFFNKKKG